jgi:hypothetical protein
MDALGALSPGESLQPLKDCFNSVVFRSLIASQNRSCALSLEQP